MDVLCAYKNQFLALDLIGFPGEYQGFFDLDSYKLFYRAGLKVLPVSYGLWLDKQTMCIERILRELDFPPDEYK